MSGRAQPQAPARRLGDAKIWVGFRSGSPAEHAGLELERLHVDEIARLLLQAAEFRLRGALETWPRAALSTVRWGARALEFEAWRATLHEQLEALRADGATLSPCLADLVDACLVAAAEDVAPEDVAPEDVAAEDVAAASPSRPCAARRERSATGAATADSVRGDRRSAERADVREQRTCDTASPRSSAVFAARAGASAKARGSDSSRNGAAPRRADAASERWPAARDLAQAARVLAPSARSHCALGRAHLAAGDVAAARGCFRAALASTADARSLREAQFALDELGAAPRLNSAAGGGAHGASSSQVPQS
jgi:hypothetical protein